MWIKLLIVTIFIITPVWAEDCNGNKNLFVCREDSEPPSPPPLTDANSQDLLGVDSDKDGVRDDVEIFINKNMKDLRMRNIHKLVAFILQKEVKSYPDVSKLTVLDEAKQNLWKCQSMKFENEVFAEMFDTKARVLRMIAINGHFHGKVIDTNRKCRSVQEIWEEVSKI